MGVPIAIKVTLWPRRDAQRTVCDLHFRDVNENEEWLPRVGLAVCIPNPKTVKQIFPK